MLMAVRNDRGIGPYLCTSLALTIAGTQKGKEEEEGKEGGHRVWGRCGDPSGGTRGQGNDRGNLWCKAGVNE